MKRFFSKSQQTVDLIHTQTQALQPKYTVPPVPHPCPHEHIALLVSPSGLLLRPYAPGLKHPSSHVHIAWGRQVNVEEVQGDAEDQGDWQTAGVVVYGIVGVLELTFASYLLVITARSEVGHLFNRTHTVYNVKGVTPVPLVHDRALIVVNTLASRNSQAQRPSLLLSPTSVNEVDSGAEGGEESDTEGTMTPSTTPGINVTFAKDDQIKVMAPMPIRSGIGALNARQNLNLNLEESRSGSPGSGASTPASDDSLGTSPVAKTAASRLSFWTRLSKRTSIPNTPSTLSPSISPSTSISPLNPQDHTSIDSIIHENITEPSEVLGTILKSTTPQPVTAEEKKSELEDKIVRGCVKEFTKGGMYFAYTFDITRSLQHKQEQVAKSKREDVLLASLNALPDFHAAPSSSPPRKSKVQVNPLKPPSIIRLSQDSNADRSPDLNEVDPLAEPYSTLPLWRRVDKQFWWNEWLSKPFVDAGLHPYVLPIMQGHYQIATFSIPREPVLHESGDFAVADYIVISRRSRDRAGLRYQRRGIDEDAHVANFVESESVMRVEREGTTNIFSYVQIRGSVPLFWTQTGYGLKPPPLLSPEHTHDQNLSALKRHFERTLPKYGSHCIVNLAEQQGKEAAITDAYRNYVGELGNKDVQYNQYDFHKETKGMKYENLLTLVDNLQRTFENQGYFWISNNLVMSEQKGVFRVNCIDCLDRTNVVQSAFARHVLTRQLGAVALLNSEAGKTDMDIIFNDVWANNGDAISRAYAGTSALKGDFTRTGKRDLGGLLNDGVNSLTRMYTSTFSDWFCQAIIDFMLGYRTLSVFSEFLLKLQSTDPRELIRLSKIRAEAIATCIARVLPEGESLLSGWTLFAPENLNTKVGEKFEEKVVLLTAQALYIISYDYTLDKIKIYTRVPLGDVIGITKGAYILSPLEEASRDPKQNAGFVISWRNSNQMTRVSSYSFRNSPEFAGLESMSPSITNSAFAGRPIPRTSDSFVRKSLDNASSSSPSPPISRALSSRGFIKGPILSRILSNATPSVGSETTYAAFKALPVNPTCIQRGSSTGYAEPADDLTGASTCKDAVDLMVDTIRRACEDLGSRQGEFVKDGDVVNLMDAQRMTSVYAKMEYGVKRLLWLGG